LEIRNRVEIRIRVRKLEIGLEIGIRVWKMEMGLEIGIRVWKLEMGLEIGRFYSQVVVCQEVVVNAFVCV
jgi:hypothetical protein